MLTNHLYYKNYIVLVGSPTIILFLQKTSSESCTTTLLLPLREYLKLLTLHFLDNFSIFDNFDQNLWKLLNFELKHQNFQNIKIIILTTHPSSAQLTLSSLSLGYPLQLYPSSYSQLLANYFLDSRICCVRANFSVLLYYCTLWRKLIFLIDLIQFCYQKKSNFFYQKKS